MKRMTLAMLSVLVFNLEGPLWGASSRVYSFAELKQLAQKKSWAEILDHAEDVPVAERQDSWNALVIQAAEGDLRTLYTDDALYAVDRGLQLLHRFEPLRSSSDFQMFRMEQGLPVLDRCLSNDAFVELCADRLRAFVAADPQNRELAFRAGKIARRHMFSYFSVGYFYEAVRDQPNDARCKDPDLGLAVSAGLGLPPESYAELVSQSAAVARQCWPVLQGKLMDVEEASGYTAVNLCPIVKEKNAMNALWKAKCAK